MSPKSKASGGTTSAIRVPGKPHEPVTTGFKVFADLLKEIVKPEYCTGCGSCVGSCPVDGLLGFVDDKPKFTGKGCVRCGMCYDVCPRSKTVELVNNGVPVRSAFSVGRPGPGSAMGKYYSAFTARTTDDKISERCQDGGVVITLLSSLFDSGYIDGAVVSIVGKDPLRAEPKVIRSSKEAIAAAGTRYSLSPSISVLKETALKGMHNIALVGTPCQMEGLYNMKFGASDPSLKGLVSYAIGIFCYENFHYTFYSEFLAKENKIDLKDVVKLDITSGKFKAITDKKEHSWVVKDLHEWVRKSCDYCFDLTAEMADISVGSVGSDAGMSTVLVRTLAGKDAWELAVGKGMLEFEKLEDLEALKKLNRVKKRNARKNYEALQGAPGK